MLIIKRKMLYIVFLIVIIIICAFANNFIKLREKYIDIDTKSVPVAFYDQTKPYTAKNFNLAEYDSEFFNNILKNNLNIPTKTTDNNTYLLTILNGNLEKEKEKEKDNVDLFIIVDNKITSQTDTTTSSEHLVYRSDKIYGINIHITTEKIKDTNQIRLIDYNIPGFVFDDKIEMNDPANIVISDTPYQLYKKDTTVRHKNICNVSFLYTFNKNV